ncbi:MAG: hypothetical protein O7B30_04295 [Thaumarchaeota archaeon]|nr:hypothetical protein [Nitrososphaerota archaeon]
MRRIISIILILLLSVAVITVGQSAAQASTAGRVSAFIEIADTASRHVTMLRNLVKERAIDTQASDQLLADGDMLVAEAKRLLETQELDASISSTKLAMSKFLEALDSLKESFVEAQDEGESRLLDLLERQKVRMLAIRRAVDAAGDAPIDVVSDINARIREVERRHSAISRDGRLAVGNEQAARDLENARVDQEFIVKALRDEEFKKIFERYQRFILTVETELEKLNSILERAKGADIDVSSLEARVERALRLVEEVKQAARSGELAEAREHLFQLKEILGALRTDIGNLIDLGLDQRGMD